MFNFVQVLSDSVRNGQKFEITGFTKTDAKLISIIFSTGSSSYSEQVLKIDVHYSNNKIIINDASIDNFTLQNGSKFKFLILVTKDSFDIKLNGNHICEHKCFTNKIRTVTVLGDVDRLLKINHLNREYSKVANKLALESFMPIKYQAGHVIVISGQSTDDFYIDFTEKNSTRELIHFNVRFGEESVVMNTVDAESGWWTDYEDRPEEFPFETDTPFKIAFAFTEEDFKVAVDGVHLMDFDLSRISYNDGQSLWNILNGFRITNREADTITTITSIEHIKMKPQCEGFEKLCSLNQA
ncbi:unnamed protein product [Chironomus riparius]|uniref:Galectin n=1 Tax=Chironomus riparius TaxID=315576 RepID=A0A9N9S5D1_9DIPT|nr:unnamed protein product [Chironomus riparius]